MISLRFSFQIPCHKSNTISNMQIALNSNSCLYRCQARRLLQLQPFLLPCSTPFRFPTLRPLRCRAMASSPPSVQVRDIIDLTPKETQIFQKLLEVVRHFSLPTQLRVAGGWVRDKVRHSLLKCLSLFSDKIVRKISGNSKFLRNFYRRLYFFLAICK